MCSLFTGTGLEVGFPGSTSGKESACQCRTHSSVQFSSVAQSCRTLCDPMNRSTPGLPVHHQLLEFTQTHVHPIYLSNKEPPSCGASTTPQISLILPLLPTRENSLLLKDVHEFMKLLELHPTL